MRCVHSVVISKRTPTTARHTKTLTWLGLRELMLFNGIGMHFPVDNGLQTET